MSNASRLSRPEKATVAKSVRDNLVERQAKGPPEPGLDIYITELAEVAEGLGTHVTGKTSADAARVALLDQVDVADDDVDTWFRYIESFLAIAGRRRRGEYVAAALAVHDAAFPDGLAPVDDYIVDQNIYCQAAITVLKAPEHAATLSGIKMPADWIPSFEAAVKKSQALFNELVGTRGEKSTHIGLGRDAEVAFADVMARLQGYLGSRAKRGETEKALESKQLLQPLTVAVQKMKAEAAARATLRDKKKDAPATPAPEASGNAGGGEKPA